MAAAAVKEREQVEVEARPCSKCGQPLPADQPRWRVHEECLTDPKITRLRERMVKAAEAGAVRKNGLAAFAKRLDATTDAELAQFHAEELDRITFMNDDMDEKDPERMNTVQLRHRVVAEVINRVQEKGRK